ncbi:MAG: hypothetical protein ACLGJB_25645 [Blastocatellia bacterium]
MREFDGRASDVERFKRELLRGSRGNGLLGYTRRETTPPVICV